MSGNINVSPCFGCPDRKARCHGGCEAYNKWAVLQRKVKAAKRPTNTEGSMRAKMRYLTNRIKTRTYGCAKVKGKSE